MLQTKTLQQTAHLESLGSSLQHFTPKAVERVIALFRPLLPAGVSMPDVALVLQLLLQLLMDAGTQVIESNWQRHEESVADRGLRENRDETTRSLRAKLFRIRDLFYGALGPQGPRLLALDEAIDAVPGRLLQQAIYVSRRLLDPKLLDGLEPWSPLEPAKLAALIEPDLKRLRATVEGLEAEKRTSEESLLALRETQARSRRFYVQGAKIVEGFYRLVGMDEEAGRIRLARRRTASPPEAAPPSGATDAEVILR